MCFYNALSNILTKYKEKNYQQTTKLNESLLTDLALHFIWPLINFSAQIMNNYSIKQHNFTEFPVGVLIMQFYTHPEKVSREGSSVFFILFNLLQASIQTKQLKWNTASLPKRVSLVPFLAAIPFAPLPFFLCFWLSLSFHPQALWNGPRRGGEIRTTPTGLCTGLWQPFNTNAISGLTLAWNICFPDNHQL